MTKTIQKIKEHIDAIDAIEIIKIRNKKKKKELFCEKYQRIQDEGVTTKWYYENVITPGL